LIRLCGPREFKKKWCANKYSIKNKLVYFNFMVTLTRVCFIIFYHKSKTFVEINRLIEMLYLS